MQDEHQSIARDPRIDALDAEWKDHLRTEERREAQHHDTLNVKRAAHAAHVDRRVREAARVENEEGEHLRQLRVLRRELDAELLAAEDAAGKALANIGLEYVPGKTKVADVHRANSLPEAEAARRAGVPSATTRPTTLLKFLKAVGMIGCLLLGTAGLGALFLRIQPKALIHSPLLPIALAFGGILVACTYLVVAPTSYRAGAAIAAQPESKAAKQTLLLTGFIVAFMCVVVALVDAKMITAINAVRTQANPSLAPSFFVTFLVGLGLSASYVIGTSTVAYAEGFGVEARARIEAEQARHLQERLRIIDVCQACEALNDVSVIEGRRRALSVEIQELEEEYRSSLAAVFSDMPPEPVMPEEHQNELRLHKQEARFAGQKLKAYEAVRGKLAAPQAIDEEVRP